MKYSKNQKNNFGKGDITRNSNKNSILKKKSDSKSRKYRSHLDYQNNEFLEDKYQDVENEILEDEYLDVDEEYLEDEYQDVEIVNKELHRKTRRGKHFINNIYNESPREYVFFGYTYEYDWPHLIAYIIFLIIMLVIFTRSY